MINMIDPRLKTGAATSITTDVIESSDALTNAGKKRRDDNEFNSRQRAIHQKNSYSVAE